MGHRWGCQFRWRPKNVCYVLECLCAFVSNQVLFEAIWRMHPQRTLFGSANGLFVSWGIQNCHHWNACLKWEKKWWSFSERRVKNGKHGQKTYFPIHGPWNVQISPKLHRNSPNYGVAHMYWSGDQSSPISQGMEFVIFIVFQYSKKNIFISSNTNLVCFIGFSSDNLFDGINVVGCSHVDALLTKVESKKREKSFLYIQLSIERFDLYRIFWNNDWRFYFDIYWTLVLTTSSEQVDMPWVFIHRKNVEL